MIRSNGPALPNPVEGHKQPPSGSTTDSSQSIHSLRPSALPSESSGLSLLGAPTLREPIYPPLLMPTGPITPARFNLMCTYVALRRDGLD